MDIIATQKYILTSPRKLREVVAVIKKLSPVEAVELLPYVEKRAAEPLMKTLKTAIANAEQKKASPADLIFKEIQIGEGPRLKRWRAGARGRAKPYKRRMSHIRIVLSTKEKVAAPKSKKETAKPKAKDAKPKTKTRTTKKKGEAKKK